MPRIKWKFLPTYEMTSPYDNDPQEEDIDLETIEFDEPIEDDE